jgi:cytochrome bd-type quinol oxidase subunit 2
MDMGTVVLIATEASTYMVIEMIIVIIFFVAIPITPLYLYFRKMSKKIEEERKKL